MSETSSQEPTMEEILASIRRIISEDEAPAEGAAPAPPEPEPEPVAAASDSPTSMEDQIAAIRAAAGVAAEEADDGDLELTQKVETHGDLDFVEAEPAPEPAAAEAEFDEPLPPLDDLVAEAPAAPADGLVSASVAAATAATFGRLSSGILMPAEGRTLEDVVREMLRPMLQQWLDDNLPAIVQQAVDAEVDRISRGRVR